MALGVAAFFAGLWMLVLTVMGLGYCTYKLLSNKNSRKQVGQHCFNTIKNTTDLLDKLFAEYQQFDREFEEYDGIAEKINLQLAKL